MSIDTIARGVFEIQVLLKKKSYSRCEQKTADLLQHLEAKGAIINKAFYANGTYTKTKRTSKQFVVSKTTNKYDKLLKKQLKEPSDWLKRKNLLEKKKKLFNFSGACDYFTWREYLGWLKKNKIDGIKVIEIINGLKPLEDFFDKRLKNKE